MEAEAALKPNVLNVRYNIRTLIRITMRLCPFFPVEEMIPAYPFKFSISAQTISKITSLPNGVDHCSFLTRARLGLYSEAFFSVSFLSIRAAKNSAYRAATSAFSEATLAALAASVAYRAVNCATVNGGASNMFDYDADYE